MISLLGKRTNKQVWVAIGVITKVGGNNMALLAFGLCSTMGIDEATEVFDIGQVVDRFGDAVEAGDHDGEIHASFVTEIMTEHDVGELFHGFEALRALDHRVAVDGGVKEEGHRLLKREHGYSIKYPHSFSPLLFQELSMNRMDMTNEDDNLFITITNA